MPVVYAGGFSPWSGSHTLSATVYTDPQLGHVEWFLRHTVRTALVERLRLDLERSGLPPKWLVQPDRLHLSRFTEYSHANRGRVVASSTGRRCLAENRRRLDYRSRSLDGARPSPGSSRIVLSPRLAVIAQA
jgi:hypothetical protein